MITKDSKFHQSGSLTSLSNTLALSLTSGSKPEKLTPSDDSVKLALLSSLSIRGPDVLLLMLIDRRAPANEELTGALIGLQGTGKN